MGLFIHCLPGHGSLRLRWRTPARRGCNAIPPREVDGSSLQRVDGG